MVIRRFQGAYRRAKDFAHFLIFHLVVVAHVEHQALLLGQRGYGFLQLDLGLIAVKVLVGLQAVDEERIVFVERNVVLNLLLVDEGYRLIDGNLVEPCRELCVAAKVVDVGPSLDKRVLQHIVGVVMVNYKPTYVPIQLLGIVLYHPPERCAACLLLMQLLYDAGLVVFYSCRHQFLNTASKVQKTFHFSLITREFF